MGRTRKIDYIKKCKGIQGCRERNKERIKENQREACEQKNKHKSQQRERSKGREMVIMRDEE